MNHVRVRNIVIGEGKPKIVVPIIARTEKEIEEQLQKILQQKIDILEWRGDWFEGIFDCKRVEDILGKLRNYVGEIPILFTFRTAKEGGQKKVSKEVYNKININIAKMQLADLMDVEGFAFENAEWLIKELKQQNLKVIISHHNFEKTLSKSEMIEKLCKMQEMGADLVKMAMMPKSTKDVLELLDATEEMNRLYAKQPIVTMSMTEKGLISRLAGEFFGSALTFGAVGKTSAPGQIDVRELDFILTTIHNQLR